MDDGHFTFLGYREYEILAEGGEDVLRAVSGSGLGILRATDDRPISVSFAQLPPEVRRLAREKPAQPDEGELSATVTAPPTSTTPSWSSGSTIPARSPASDASSGSIPTPPTAPVPGRSRCSGGRLSEWSSARAFARAATTTSRSWTSSRPTRAMSCSRSRRTKPSETALGILHLGERRHVRLFVRGTCSNGSSPAWSISRVNGSTPRIGSRSRTSCRRRSAARASTTRHASRSRSSRASMWSCTRSRARFPNTTSSEPEARLAAATRSWADDLRDALLEQLGEERAGPLFERYGEAFPGAYREDFTPRQAVLDIERIERLDPDGDLGMSLYLPLAATLDHLAFKLVRSGQPLLLSDVLPLLENMGVKITTSVRTRSARLTGHRSGSTTSASATTRGPSSRRMTCARCSRTRSHAPGEGSRRPTASTASSSQRGDRA